MLEACKHLVDELEQLNLVDERVGAYNVGVTLVKFAVTAFLRSVGTPHGLNLESLERELKFVTVLDNVTRKWNREVVTQSLFTQLRCELAGAFAGVEQCGVGSAQVVARVQNLKEELVAFFAVFPHKC